jgi:hypothetical protein
MGQGVERLIREGYIKVNTVPPSNSTKSMPKKRSLGFDVRYRDSAGEIRHKRGDTLVRTLRETYGSDFAAGYRSDMTLSEVLKRTGSKSLREFVVHNKRGTRIQKAKGTSAISNTILSITSSRFEPALRSLAKK